jgi:hypothetical protein
MDRRVPGAMQRAHARVGESIHVHGGSVVHVKSLFCIPVVLLDLRRSTWCRASELRLLVTAWRMASGLTPDRQRVANLARQAEVGRTALDL